MIEKVKNWISKYSLILMFVLLSIVMEVVSVYAVDGVIFLKSPRLFLTMWGFVVFLVMAISNNKVRMVICTIFLLLHGILDLVFVVIYDMTGQYFDFGMFYLRNDAMGILESIPMNFIAFYSTLLFCSLFIIFGRRIVRRQKTIDIKMPLRIVFIVCALACGGMMGYATYQYNSNSVNKYDKMLNQTQGSYSDMGILGNLINEISKGLVYDDTEKLSDEEIESYLYEKVAEESPYFGVSKDNNVVMVLVESFEWFSFITNEEYPNGLGFTKEQQETLFPNLTKFYNESVVATNYHSKEKTDISETLSILGAYPTDSYINYDFGKNTMPETVPNTMAILSKKELKTQSFHNGYKSFYNREVTHKSFGFESLTDSYDMMKLTNDKVEKGIINAPTMVNYLESGERNLDSEMIETCKDEMFPTDQRFYTYITTITMHGIYYERDNLKDNMELLRSVYKPKKENDEYEQMLMNYVTTVMDFDKALGIMMKDLEEKDLLDKTTIVIFGDHNAYYQQLSNTVKDIYDYDTKNYYTDLYKVPLMIYDQKVEAQKIDKFTCTSDMVPTVLDLLGIHYYDHMYYGHSIFSETESAMYSRAYGIFVGEGIVLRNFNDILYKSKKVDDAYMENYKKTAAELVGKIKFCDQIFYNDYFGDETHFETFKEKLKEIN